MLFCMFVGTAFAEVNSELISKKITIGADATTVDENQWYVLYNHNRQVCVSEETSAFKMRTVPANGAVAESNAGMLFKFVAVEGQDGQYYIVSGNGLYFDFMNNNSSTVSTTPVAYNVAQIGDNAGHFYIQHADNGFIADGQSNGENFVCWEKNVPASAGGNNCYHLRPVTLEDVALYDVTYNYYVGGVLKHTEIIEKQAEGAAVSAPTFGYVTFTAPTGTVSAENCTFNIDCTLEETPIVFSADVNNPTWQIVEMHRFDGNRFWFYNASSKQVNVYYWATPYDAVNEAYWWCFVGDQFGFKIYNKAAGTEVTLNATSGTPTVGVASNGNDNWILAKSGYDAYKDVVNTTVCFTNDRTNYMNQQSGVAKYWSSNDNGSTCFIHTLSDKVKTAADALYADVSSGNPALTGYVGTYGASAEQIEELNECKNADPFNVEVAKNMIDEILATKVGVVSGNYYRMVCVAPKTGNRGDTNYNTLTFNGNNNFVTAPMDLKNINQVVQFVDAGEGKYYLQSPNAGKCLSNIAAGGYRAHLVAQTDEGVGKLTLEALGEAQYQIKGNYALFAENHPTEAIPYACAGWTEGKNSPSAWYIIPATELEVEVASAYGSIYLPFDVTLAEGVKAYAVTATSETSATLTEKEDIPAGEGAILAQGSYTLNIAAATSDWATNMLEGSNVNTYIEGNAYVLGMIDGEVGLYKAMLNTNAEGGAGTTHFLNNANKAYLPMPNNAGAQALRFNFGETTGIEGVIEGTNANAVIFDLSGRRVAKMQKGIYIVNGKKVYVK